MQTITAPVPSANTNSSSRPIVWAGRILSAIFLLFMALDITMHLANPPQAVAAFDHLGFPDSLSRVIAVISLVNVGLYVIPRTAVLGAILETGYLGGAVASHVRVGDSSYFFAILVAAVMWASLYCRDA